MVFEDYKIKSYFFDLKYYGKFILWLILSGGNFFDKKL